MNFFQNVIVLQLLCLIFGYYGVYGWKYPGEEYPASLYYNNGRNKYDTAVDKLGHAHQLVSGWPDPSVKLGQVSAVALDNEGRVLVFHRGPNTWGINTFSDRDVYNGIGEPPIPQPTILLFNDTGELVDYWGQNMFFMPHGITVDGHNNVWVTDVALHQVLKFSPTDRVTPELTLGEKFVPGDDDKHFCKPTAVAVLATGEFFVADGYCNTRIIKYAADGTVILQWGQKSGSSPYVLRVPHGLALAGSALCVADRERGRVACFRAADGAFLHHYSSWLLGARCFGLAYSPANGGRLYVVNGPYGGSPRVRGWVLDASSGRLLDSFGPDDDFSNPHALAVSPDGARVYVAELDPHRVYKFVSEVPEVPADQTRSRPLTSNRTAAAAPLAKPTATVEEGEWWGRGWAGAAWGGAGGVAGAALLAALALARARRHGRKGVRRRWEYGGTEFKLRRLLERRRFTRVDTSDSDDERPRAPHTAAA